MLKPPSPPQPAAPMVSPAPAAAPEPAAAPGFSKALGQARETGEAPAARGRIAGEGSPQGLHPVKPGIEAPESPRDSVPSGLPKPDPLVSHPSDPAASAEEPDPEAASTEKGGAAPVLPGMMPLVALVLPSTGPEGRPSPDREPVEQEVVTSGAGVRAETDGGLRTLLETLRAPGNPAPGATPSSEAASPVIPSGPEPAVRSANPAFPASAPVPAADGGGQPGGGRGLTQSLDADPVVHPLSPMHPALEAIRPALTAVAAQERRLDQAPPQELLITASRAAMADPVPGGEAPPQPPVAGEVVNGAAFPAVEPLPEGRTTGVWLPETGRPVSAPAAVEPLPQPAGEPVTMVGPRDISPQELSPTEVGDPDTKERGGLPANRVPDTSPEPPSIRAEAPQPGPASGVRLRREAGLQEPLQGPDRVRQGDGPVADPEVWQVPVPVRRHGSPGDAPVAPVLPPGPVRPDGGGVVRLQASTGEPSLPVAFPEAPQPAHASSAGGPPASVRGEARWADPSPLPHSEGAGTAREGATPLPAVKMVPPIDPVGLTPEAILPHSSAESGTGPSSPIPHPGPAVMAGAPSTPVQEPALHASVASSHPPPPLLTQVDGSIRWILKHQQQGAELQLHPEALGKVVIQLRVEGQEVHARVWASEPSTLPVLQEHRAFLEVSLREQGLNLGSFDLQQGQQGRQAESFEARRAFLSGVVGRSEGVTVQDLPGVPVFRSLESGRIEVLA